MKCVYCGEEAKGTKEHIISCAILDLFPECYLTFDGARNVVHQSDPMIKDVCSECNNKRISYIDSYSKSFIGQYFVRKYNESDNVEIEYDYVLIQKMLLKYAFNDMRSHKDDCSFFDKEILDYLMNVDDVVAKENVIVLCGLAVNVSPMSDAMFGNLKLRWCKNPRFYSNSTIRNIDYDTGQIYLNENVEMENFPDVKFSYVFRFNSVQFLLVCCDKKSEKITQNKVVLEHQYPYYLLKPSDKRAVISLCTDEINYHRYENIHVRWDGLFEIGEMRKNASGGTYKYKQLYEQEWLKEESRIKKDHPR